MKKTIFTFAIVFVALLSGAQSLILQYGNEDHSLGALVNAPVIKNKFGLSAGYKQGTYSRENYNIDHKRYLAAISIEDKNQLFTTKYENESYFVFYAGLGIHDIKINRDSNETIVPKQLNDFSLEIGAHSNIPNSRILIGFFYDFHYKEGGFSLGFLL